MLKRKIEYGSFTAPWTRFWFESNHYFDYVEDLADWLLVLESYPEKSMNEILDQAKEHPTPSRGTSKGGVEQSEEQLGDYSFLTNATPNFGFRIEHTGRSLREFFEEQGMLKMFEEAPLAEITDDLLKNPAIWTTDPMGSHIKTIRVKTTAPFRGSWPKRVSQIPFLEMRTQDRDTGCPGDHRLIEEFFQVELDSCGGIIKRQVTDFLCLPPEHPTCTQ